MQKFERERDSELRGKVDIALRDNNLFNTLHPLKVKTFNIIFFITPQHLLSLDRNVSVSL